MSGETTVQNCKIIYRPDGQAEEHAPLAAKVMPTRTAGSAESAGSSTSSGFPQTAGTAGALHGEGGLLVERLERLYQNHVKLDNGFPLVLALWNLHTYMFDDFPLTPYLWLHSPTKGCGKSTLAELLAYASHRSQFTVGITKAALYHVVDEDRPTLVLDEAEGNLDDREMIAIINAGYRRNGGEVKRWINGGLRSFKVYCPKVIASIKPIPETVFDRSIQVELKRLRDDEQVMPFDATVADEELPVAVSKWVSAHRKAVAEHYRSQPNFVLLHARAGSIWKPLFAIAEYVCPSRVGELQETALRLTAEKSLHDQERSPEMRLLEDIRAVFGRNSEKLATEALLQSLAALPESRWRRLDSLGLAKRLRPFNIRPKQLWLHGKNFRGYDLEDFQDTFTRYLPADTEERVPWCQEESEANHVS